MCIRDRAYQDLFPVDATAIAVVVAAGCTSSGIVVTLVAEPVELVSIPLQAVEQVPELALRQSFAVVAAVVPQSPAGAVEVTNCHSALEAIWRCKACSC